MGSGGGVAGRYGGWDKGADGSRRVRSPEAQAPNWRPRHLRLVQLERSRSQLGSSLRCSVRLRRRVDHDALQASALGERPGLSLSRALPVLDLQPVPKGCAELGAARTYLFLALPAMKARSRRPFPAWIAAIVALSAALGCGAAGAQAGLWRVSFAGVRGVRPGMTTAEVARRWNVRFSFSTGSARGCK